MSKRRRIRDCFEKSKAARDFTNRTDAKRAILVKSAKSVVLFICKMKHGYGNVSDCNIEKTMERLINYNFTSIAIIGISGFSPGG
jgi:hypothetical protein